MQEKLGFIPTNDFSTAILVNPKTRDSRVFSCYTSIIRMMEDIYYNHFKVTGDGIILEINYSSITVKFPLDDVIQFEYFIENSNLQVSLFDTLLSNSATEEELLKFVCDISNLRQINVLQTDLYKKLIDTFPFTEYAVLDMQPAVYNKHLHIPRELRNIFGVDYKHHWIFTK